MADAAQVTAKPDIPKGCIEAKSPNGDRIFVKPPRGPGPWFRVKHQMWGHKLVKAKTAAEAVKKYAEEVAPAESANEEWMKQLLAQCRVGKAYD